MRGSIDSVAGKPGINQGPGGGNHKKKYPPPLSLRLTIEERVALEKAASGMSLSAYIRLRLFNEDVAPRKTRNKAPVRDHKALSKALGLLGNTRIPNNLNQLMKAVHMGILPVSEGTEDEIRQACVHIRDIRNMLMSGLGLKTGA